MTLIVDVLIVCLVYVVVQAILGAVQGLWRAARTIRAAKSEAEVRELLRPLGNVDVVEDDKR